VTLYCYCSHVQLFTSVCTKENKNKKQNKNLTKMKVSGE
jgi:hypothetical protein